jgi:hypothetical protein
VTPRWMNLQDQPTGQAPAMNRPGGVLKNEKRA